MHQGVACIERRGPVKKLHLVGSELPGDVPSRGLVCFYCRQVPFYHACSPQRKRKSRKEGQKKIRNKGETKNVPPSTFA